VDWDNAQQSSKKAGRSVAPIRATALACKSDFGLIDVDQRAPKTFST